MIIAQIFEIIQKIRSEGVTVFLVEQNANRALQLADLGYVLELHYLPQLALEVEHHAVLQVVRRCHEGFLTVALHLGRADPRRCRQSCARHRCGGLFPHHGLE